MAIFELIFEGEDPCKGEVGQVKKFWDDLLMLRINVPYLQR